jgi:hypothetical protein
MTLAVNYLQRDVRALSDTSDDTGERWYPHPLTNERFLSVTTALHAVAKVALVPWSGNLAAAAAMEYLPKLVKASRRRPCGNTGDAGCGQCRTCVETWVARRHHFESEEGKRRGSAIHDVIEYAATRDWQIPDHLDRYHPWIRSFEMFVHEYQPEPFLAETTVISRSDGGWAGTLDIGVTIRGDATKQAAELCARYGRDEVRLLVDTKTTKRRANNLYPDWALQLGGGYCHAERVMFRDGREFPMPEFDGAAVLLLRPDKPHLRPIVCDETTHRGFLNAMGLFRWLDEMGAAATQVKSFPLPESAKPVKKTVTNRARKTVPAAKQTRPRSAQQAVDPFASHRHASRPAGARLDDTDIPF